MTFTGSVECCNSNGFSYTDTGAGTAAYGFLAVYTGDPGECSLPL